MDLLRLADRHICALAGGHRYRGDAVLYGQGLPGRTRTGDRPCGVRRPDRTPGADEHDGASSRCVTPAARRTTFAALLDADDQKFDLAARCQADLLITRDKLLLKLAHHRHKPPPCPIVTTAETACALPDSPVSAEKPSVSHPKPVHRRRSLCLRTASVLLLSLAVWTRQSAPSVPVRAWHKN